MSAVSMKLRRRFRERVEGWNRFWFTPAAPETLALIRVMAGAMLFYTHFVWALDLSSFLGEHSWISRDAWEHMRGDALIFSYLWWLKSPAALWVAHLVALVVFLMMTVGLYTRVATVLAWFITINYCHRLMGAQFGLDQINVMLAMYLMLGTSGDAYSLDQWRRRRRGEETPPARVSTNVAIRLIQLHLCVIYFFGGLAKMHGSSWWDGSATWMSVANYEYQSLDMTWLAAWPTLTALLTHVTVFWEAYYCFLVWPRVTRPLILLLAVGVHGGIALCLGMITFGVIMLVANLAFVSPNLIRSIVSKLLPERDFLNGAGQRR